MIWKAGNGDGPRLNELEKSAFAGRGWSDNSITESLGAPGVEVLFGGAERGLAQGFVIWRVLPGEAEILSIGVEAPARRSGLGRRLLEAANGAARRGGAAAMFLEVEAGNAAAIDLYRTEGFEEVGVRPAYYRHGADALIMRKPL